jgi:RNA polymerase sigma-32 factor
MGDDEGAEDRGFAPPDFEDVGPIEIDPDRDVLDEAERTLPVVKPEIVDRSESSSKALTTTDPIALYLAEIRKYPLLTKEQERELAMRYRETGDPKAAELLVTSNLRFVVKIAAEYSRFGAKLIDLIQEGNVGLMHAVKEFNPYKGVRLITYAVWWIRGYIQEYLMRQYSMVRIGTTQNQRKLFYRLQKEREALEAMGQEPNFALLAGRLGVTEEEVETMSQRMANRDLSLNTPIDGGASTSTLLDFEPGEGPLADETIGHLEEMEVLKRNLEQIRPSLNEKETYILEKRVLADEPMTLQEIGEHYGVTREAVRQLEARLIQKIRNAVTSSLAGE